jgi:hypothetical protein
MDMGRQDELDRLGSLVVSANCGLRLLLHYEVQTVEVARDGRARQEESLIAYRWLRHDIPKLIICISPIELAEIPKPRSFLENDKDLVQTCYIITRIPHCPHDANSSPFLRGVRLAKSRGSGGLVVSASTYIRSGSNFCAPSTS